MLGDVYAERVEGTDRAPLFRSKRGGFIARFDRPQIQQILMKAQSQGRPAEEVVEQITAAGDTLHYARITFSVFVAASAILVVAVTLTMLNRI